MSGACCTGADGDGCDAIDAGDAGVDETAAGAPFGTASRMVITFLDPSPWVWANVTTIPLASSVGSRRRSCDDTAFGDFGQPSGRGRYRAPCACSKGPLGQRPSNPMKETNPGN